MKNRSNHYDQNLIETILKYQDLDSLLRLGVVLSNLQLDGDGCSLFLRDSERDDLELKESTVLTRFLGQPLNIDTKYEGIEADKIRDLLARIGLKPEDLDETITEEDVAGWDPEIAERIRRFGLTRWAVQFQCPLVIKDIHRDVRWSSFRHSESDAQHCELAHEDIYSIVVTLLGKGSGGLPRGVLRVVRRRQKPGFERPNLDWLTWFADCVDRCMVVAGSLTELMEIGTRLKFDDFGNRLVRLLQKVFGATGCSIFLELGPAKGGVKTFQCIATTGLFDKKGTPVARDEARYQVDLKKKESGSVTVWVLRHGQLLALEEGTWSFDRSRFPDLNRELGHGTYREADRHSPERPAGPLLICPLFLYQGREAAGAIRLVRPKGSESFEPHLQFLFLDIARRLSGVLTNLNLRQVSEGLIELCNRPDEMLRRIPPEVCRLLGVEGCSVFRLRQGRFLRLEATKGLLENREDEIVYDISDSEVRGKTGAVAFLKESKLLNSPAAGRQPSGSRASGSRAGRAEASLCEVEDPYRYLAVPIFSEPKNPHSEVLGVIRVLRQKEDPPFAKEIHQSILVSFAARLSLALNIAYRNECLEAIAELASPLPPGEGEAGGHPSLIAQQMVGRTVEVLTEQLGLETVAVYGLRDRTQELQLRDVRSISDEPFAPYSFLWPSEARSPISLANGLIGLPIQLGDIRIGMMAVRTFEGAPLSSHQTYLLKMATGHCASVLYNESAFERLKTIRQGLVEVGQEVTSKSRLVTKLESIAQVAADVTQADCVIIHEFIAPPPDRPVTEGRFCESARGGPTEPREWKETNFKPDAVPFKVIQNGEAVFAAVAADSQTLFHPKAGANFIVRERISSAAALPLIAGDTCVGCIFFNFREGVDFDPRHRQEIRMMTDFAATAIYQGRLLAETRQLVSEKSYLLRYADHSLSQPLNSLLGFLSNLANAVYLEDIRQINDLDSFEKSALARYAKQQYRLCRYVRYLNETFLGIDRIDTAQVFEVDPTSNGDLSDACLQAVEIAEAYLCGEIDRNIAAGVSGCFDINAVKTAVLNVLVNAVKYGRGQPSPAGVPPVGLSLRCDRTTHPPRAVIEVDDSGPGIDPLVRDSLFERGVQADPQSPGLGIGLFLTRGYVKAHGGDVLIGSSPRGGARFIITLPLKERYS